MNCLYYDEDKALCKRENCHYYGIPCPVSEYPKLCKKFQQKDMTNETLQLADNLRKCALGKCEECTLKHRYDCDTAIKKMAAVELERLMKKSPSN